MNIYIDNFNTKVLSNINIGGMCKYYTEVLSENDIINTIDFCNNNNIYYRIVGDGSNLYFSDYFNGMIIKNNYKTMHNIDNYFIVSSGTTLFDFILYACEYGYDLSKLVGIPGTIGGAIYGNAGAYGTDMSQIVSSCLILNKDNNVINMNNNDLQFSYRNSFLKTNNVIILSTKIKIKKSNLSIHEIKQKIKEVMIVRINKFQIKNTLGSIFKNILLGDNKIYAWKLLDALNLRNKTIYNITISKTHPNIFINNGNASSSDMNNILNYIVKNINQKFNIVLEKEIEYIF